MLFEYCILAGVASLFFLPAALIRLDTQRIDQSLPRVVRSGVLGMGVSNCIRSCPEPTPMKGTLLLDADVYSPGQEVAFYWWAGDGFGSSDDGRVSVRCLEAQPWDCQQTGLDREGKAEWLIHLLLAGVGGSLLVGLALWFAGARLSSSA